MNNSYTAFEDFPGSAMATAKLALTARPAGPIFDRIILRPAETVPGGHELLVINTGSITLIYRLFAAWTPVPPTTAVEALWAAERTVLSIRRADPPAMDIFKGSLAQLYDQPVEGRLLAPQGGEKLRFCISLPLLSGPVALTTIKVNFILAAEHASS